VYTQILKETIVSCFDGGVGLNHIVRFEVTNNTTSFRPSNELNNKGGPGTGRISYLASNSNAIGFITLNYTISLHSSKSIKFYTSQLSAALEDGHFTRKLRAKAKAADATHLINVNATKSFEIIKYSVDSDDDITANATTDDEVAASWYESKGAIIGYIVAGVLIAVVIAYYSLKVIIYKKSAINYSPSPSRNNRSHPSSSSANIRKMNERSSVSPSRGLSLYSSAVSNKNGNVIRGVNPSHRYVGITDLEAGTVAISTIIARPVSSTFNSSTSTPSSASTVYRQTALVKSESVIQL
jgi:hypothetical protein